MRSIAPDDRNRLRVRLDKTPTVILAHCMFDGEEGDLGNPKRRTAVSQNQF
jgi:hypothetical protein